MNKNFKNNVTRLSTGEMIKVVGALVPPVGVIAPRNARMMILAVSSGSLLAEKLRVSTPLKKDGHGHFILMS